jgi:hypothetical protein
MYQPIAQCTWWIKLLTKTLNFNIQIQNTYTFSYFWEATLQRDVGKNWFIHATRDIFLKDHVHNDILVYFLNTNRNIPENSFLYTYIHTCFCKESALICLGKMVKSWKRVVRRMYATFPSLYFILIPAFYE